MSNTAQLLIPPKLRVGFQNREGTYTGKLAYVIYFDGKGELRKAKSWESWRDKNIDARDFDNAPTEGFVLNKGVGGQRQSWGWHARNEYVRVYDPRDFEFEISVANLLFILREGTCHPGKGLEGEFVYAWSGTELVLLPVKSVDYQQSSTFTALQTQAVKARDLVAGHTYVTKRQEHWVYLGRFDYFYSVDAAAAKDPGVCKKHVFAKIVDGKWQIIYQNDVKAVAAVVSSVCVDNFAELVEMHTRSARGSRIARLVLRPGKERPLGNDRHSWNFEETPGIFAEARTYYRRMAPQDIAESTDVDFKLSVNDGALVVQKLGYGTKYAYHPDYKERYYDWRSRDYTFGRTPTSPHPWREPTNDRLFAVLECGAEVEVGPYSLSKG